MKFYVHKLGCPKNDVDADYISARLIAEGHEPVSSPEDAESIVVNTCGFILPAKEESINEILRLGQLKREGMLKTIYAAGCLSQRYGDEMLDEIEELDGAFGLGALDSIAGAVSDSKQIGKTIKIEPRKLGYLSWKDRFISDDLPYAYVKISDGCDRGCTYCAIPGMRGRFRSRPAESIVREAKFLAENGKRELILVSQEATFGGYNLPGNPTIINLLQQLENVNGIEWIRLMYLFPPAVDQDLIEYMGAKNKTLNYYDLPLQHINSDILESMKRQIDRSGIEHLIQRIRDNSPEATLRTTFLVGFPGETEEHFDELVQFTKDIGFDRMGVFPYSAEEGTPAEKMGEQVEESIKHERVDTLMTLQREINFEKNNSLIGTTVEVIIDRLTDERIGIGRTTADCPDIDQVIHITGMNLSIGRIGYAKIDSSDGYDFYGTWLEDM